jgi:predicted GNAT family acetyltransferase
MMVERLVADARAQGVRITPACWFVADEFARHAPDWNDVLDR